MLKASGTVAVFAFAGTGALADGIERSTQSALILFQDGNYAEFSLGAVAPDVSGSTSGFPFGSASSGDMAGDYTAYSFGYKQTLSDKLDFALILDQPIGANVDYPAGGSYALRGTTAELDSTALTGLLRYKWPSSGISRFSAFGGVRLEQVSGNVTINFPPAGVVPYTLSTNTSTEPGFVVGMAWERPDIAARVAVTYNSAISHTLAMTETVNGSVPQTTNVPVDVPQSVNIEFQTGVAKDTLLFGSVRWVDWTQFKIAPPLYGIIFPSNPDLVSYQHDRITYNLGLGHKFSDTWSGAVTLGYQPSNGDVTGNLGPVDGYAFVGVGATYTQGNVQVTGGIRYMEIGGADTTIGAKFRDNSAVAAGIKVGFSF